MVQKDNADTWNWHFTTAKASFRYSCTAHFYKAPSTFGRLDRPLSPRPIIRSHFEFHFWEVKLYEALCREEIPNPQLYCFYHAGNENDYWLLLGPVRTEVLYENPRIVQFYDVVHNSEIDHIKSISKNMMDRSMVADEGSGEGSKSHERNVLHTK